MNWTKVYISHCFRIKGVSLQTYSQADGQTNKLTISCVNISEEENLPPSKLARKGLEIKVGLLYNEVVASLQVGEQIDHSGYQSSQL